MSVKPIYLLSPARTNGPRATMLLRPQASFELAMQLRTPAGVAIANVFSFLSGLYFRGKVAYARRFADHAFVITADRGLLPLDAAVTASDLQAMSLVPIDIDESRYTKPLTRDLENIRDEHLNAPIVLLGSVATKKYVDVLLPVLGERLKFPEEFIGRGDMSRGGLMLRRAKTGESMNYLPVLGAIRRGTRPPKLTPQ